MSIYYFILKILRRIYILLFPIKRKTFVLNRSEADLASDKIYSSLISEKPCMIARIGATERNVLKNYIAINSEHRSALDFITNKSQPWWWNRNILNNFKVWSGFFPIEIPLVEKYCELVFSDLPEIDIIGSWRLDDDLCKKELKNAQKVQIEYLEPFFSNNLWTKALEGKKILVVHPFQQSIEKQYKKRELLFKNNLLPSFELKTIKAVQTVANEKSDFKDWFEALEFMKKQMNQVDYDIALIGCGAYGLHLAAHAKRMGKKGFHLAGVLQMLFGIIGKRWEKPTQANGIYLKLFNEHWTRPTKDETPKNAHLVESSNYW
ncbi:MAG: hypothetical protein CMQ73_04120 [Gammaproteobacteria bacterium]|nr:hypothetical protein [Gammaproteobacteria bacterium]|tara:strand:+ start:11 stop:970 length:960 start_codon:yes stop_codon:yes gene_type:complete